MIMMIVMLAIMCIATVINMKTTYDLAKRKKEDTKVDSEVYRK